MKKSVVFSWSTEWHYLSENWRRKYHTIGFHAQICRCQIPNPLRSCHRWSRQIPHLRFPYQQVSSAEWSFLIRDVSRQEASQHWMWSLLYTMHLNLRQCHYHYLYDRWSLLSRHHVLGLQEVRRWYKFYHTVMIKLERNSDHLETTCEKVEHK